ncbi:glutaredoxin family protein [Candidatus Peregrinibacteria bacterium]|nr:glutaredoxin family protein [Candidatus Peregrinibacteria bacterium]
MKSINIYSTPTCGFCKQLKKFLSEKEISFSDHDVTEDSSAFETMQKLTDGGTGVPVIVFNQGKPDQEIQVGFDLQKVQTALELA